MMNREYGRIRTAILETIRICKDRNVLKEYLSEREKDVEAIILAMYDEKEILMEYIRSERYEAAQEAAKEAKRESAKETAIQMLKAGKLSVDEIMQFFPILTSDDIKGLQEELLQNA